MSSEAVEVEPRVNVTAEHDDDDAVAPLCAADHRFAVSDLLP